MSESESESGIKEWVMSHPVEFIIFILCLVVGLVILNDLTGGTFIRNILTGVSWHVPFGQLFSLQGFLENIPV